MAQAGVTHDLTFTLASETFGFIQEQGSSVEETVNDFAPTIGVGDNPAFAEGAWRAWEQSGGTEGIDQRLFTNKQKILWSDGLTELTRDGVIQLNSKWNSSDAAVTLTAPMIIDFSTNRVAVGAGTKIRRFDTSAETWAASTTTLGANAIFLYPYSTSVFVACGAGADLYSTTDLDTLAQPAAGQKATCFVAFQEKLWLGHTNFIKSSTDLGVTWAAAVNVGNPSTNILNMVVAFNALFIRKEDGLYYTTNGSTIVEVYINKNTKYAGNKTLLYHIDGFLYMGEMSSIKKFSISSGSITNMVDVTPIMDVDSDKDLYGHGTPIWLWSGPGGAMYAAFDDGEGVYPEVLKFTGLGWQQAYRGTSGDTMRAGGYSQLMGYIFISDGATRLRKMVTLKDWPRADYPTTGGEFYTSFFDAGLPQMPKGFGSIRVWARDVSATKYITIYYRENDGDAWTLLGTVTEDIYPNPITIPFDQTDKAIGANAVQLRFVFISDSATATPVLTRFSVKYLNRPFTVNGYSMTLNLKAGQNLLDGTMEAETIAARYGFLRKVKDSLSPVIFTDRAQVRHIVYVSKLSKRNPVQHIDTRTEAMEGQEMVMDVVCVDAYDGLTPQLDNAALLLSYSYTTSLSSQSDFNWGSDADELIYSFGQWE